MVLDENYIRLENTLSSLFDTTKTLNKKNQKKTNNRDIFNGTVGKFHFRIIPVGLSEIMANHNFLITYSSKENDSISVVIYAALGSNAGVILNKHDLNHLMNKSTGSRYSRNKKFNLFKIGNQSVIDCLFSIINNEFSKLDKNNKKHANFLCELDGSFGRIRFYISIMKSE